MNVEFTHRFEKQTDDFTDEKLRQRIKNIIEVVRQASTPRQIPHLKKLIGFSEFYRIKIGDYRIGIRISGSTVIFAAFGLRKDIYRSFP